MRKSRPAKNVFTYTAPSARIAMPSTPASCSDAATHRSSSFAPGLRRWMRLANDSVAYTVPSAATAMSLQTPPLRREGIGALGGTALQVEGSQGGLPDDGRATTAAGVVLAHPQRAGLVVREHAEHVGQAGRRRLNPGFGLRGTRRGTVDRAFRRAAEVHGAVLTRRQVLRLDAGVVDRDLGTALRAGDEARAT